MVECEIEAKTENRYDLFQKIDTVRLVTKGILSVHLLDWIIFYEKFLIDFEKTGAKCQSYQNVAEDYNVSFDTVKRAVKYMSS